MDSTLHLIVAAVLQLALLASLTALAIAGVIPGSTVVALLGSHLAIRAFVSMRPPSPPSSGSSSSSTSPEQLPPRGFARMAFAAVALAVLRVFDPLIELTAIAAGGAAVLQLVEGLRPEEREHEAAPLSVA